MMDTVLNLGLNDTTVEGLAARTRNERFAWDCYRRFITIFGDVVLGIERAGLRRAARRARRRAPGAKTDADVPAAELRELVAELQGARAGQDRAGRSRRTRTSSSGWPSTPSSTPGSPRRRWTTAASTGCPTTGAPR